ncbi:MAG: hypothetical protein O3B31_12330 [Chloroflexi bacterium]|nr:hypothetical protein [Chloroflexota bacterium]MQC28024.1 hypothetical protein [Chloroflexota bacterium]
MPAIPQGPLARAERTEVANYLAERLSGAVSLDVWTVEDSPGGLIRTDRDVCTKCPDVLALVRQITTLHPALTVTPYNLQRHADRAAAAHVELAPTVVVRGHGRSVQLVGLFAGALFPVMLDAIGFASNGLTPVQKETRAALQALTAPVTLEAMVEPYDGYSAHLARLVAAFGVESKQIRARVVEMAEFPILAGQRTLNEVPALTINGRRFAGTWFEDDLLAQITRVLEGNTEPVIRDQVLTTPYLSEDDALELARQQSAAQSEAQQLAPRGDEETSGGGLYIPGRG